MSLSIMVFYADDAVNIYCSELHFNQYINNIFSGIIANEGKVVAHL